MSDSKKYADRPERHCAKCGILFSGYRCKSCQAQRKKEYIDANRDHVNRSNREWRKSNPDKQRTAVNNWRLNNPDKSREMSRRYAAKHQEQRRINCSEWRKKNTDRIKKSWQEWSKKNTEHLKEKRRIYEESFPERVQAGKHTRRTRLLNIFSKIDPEYVKFLKVTQDMCCNYCGQTMIKFQIDHIVPIARGGDNSNENLQLLCAPCNRQKGAKTDSEYREYLNVIRS